MGAPIEYDASECVSEASFYNTAPHRRVFCVGSRFLFVPTYSTVHVHDEAVHAMSDERASWYELRAGRRHVLPYKHPFTCHAKGRWIGRTVLTS